MGDHRIGTTSTTTQGDELSTYDAGLLGNGGGGDVDWWQDYIRAELARAHDFYAEQFDAILKLLPPSSGLEERLRRLEADSHPPIDLTPAMDALLDERGYEPRKPQQVCSSCAGCGLSHGGACFQCNGAGAVNVASPSSSEPDLTEAQVLEAVQKGARGEKLTPQEHAAWTGYELGWRDGRKDGSPPSSEGVREVAGLRSVAGEALKINGRFGGAPPSSAAKPKRGDVRVVDGLTLRFIEEELEGEKWEVIGVAPSSADCGPGWLNAADLSEVNRTFLARLCRQLSFGFINTISLLDAADLNTFIDAARAEGRALSIPQVVEIIRAKAAECVQFDSENVEALEEDRAAANAFSVTPGQQWRARLAISQSWLDWLDKTIAAPLPAAPNTKGETP